MKKPNIIWSPFPKQRRALECPAFELGYGGAPGGGKSDFTLVDPLKQVSKQGFRALILRRKMVDLERSLILRSLELYKGRAQYDGQKKRWKFPNDCWIEFGHCQRPNDVNNYKSAAYSYIGFEQVEEFTEAMYTYLFSRVRTTNPEIKPKVRCNFNPGGIGHTWIKKRFWINDETHPADRLHEVKEYLTRPDGKTEEFSYKRAFIPALVYDNDFIMKNDRQYLMRLMQLPEPTRTAYLEGRFDLFEGQFFKEWNPKVHVIDPFEIPATWRRSIAFDWGYNDPTVVLWFAEDPQTGIVYVYRELHINETIDIEVAKLLVEMSGDEKIYCIYYPWDLDNKNPQTGVSMHERMDAVTGNRFWWKEGNKQRLNGWISVRNLLSIRPDGKPRMMVFRNCLNLIRTFPEQVFDDTNPEDLDTLGDDHCCLVAGTQILTHNDDYIGWQPIEDISVGDEVMTREGFRKVLVSAKTDEQADVIRVKTSFGTIIGTANHPIFMADGSKKSLGNLEPGEELFDIRAYVLIQLGIWKLKSLLQLAKNLTENVITVADTISKGMGFACTASFGNIITTRFQTNTTSIISTRINPTTKFQISNSYAEPFTYPNIQDSLKFGSVQGRICLELSMSQQKNGMAQKLALSSISGSESNHGKLRSGVKRFASSAAEFTKLLSLNVLDGVISIAKWLTFVPPVKVLELKTLPTKQAVYNLEVEEHHEYIANNLLVSNCDALRYFSATFRANPIDQVMVNEEKIYDVGGATKKQDKFYFKKEEQRMAFNWMVE